MSEVVQVLTVVSLFTVKHFIADYPLQVPPYMWQNKGTYAHPGGILHSAIQALGTLLICLFYAPIQIAFALAWADYVLHYHVDWAKMRINSYFGWMPESTWEYWILLGIDQMLHYFTYIAIVYYLFEVL